MKRWNCWLRPSGFAGLSEGSCSPHSGAAGAGGAGAVGLGARSAPPAGSPMPEPASCGDSPDAAAPGWCLFPRDVRRPPLVGSSSSQTSELPGLWLFFIALFPTLWDYRSKLKR